MKNKMKMKHETEKRKFHFMSIDRVSFYSIQMIAINLLFVCFWFFFLCQKGATHVSIAHCNYD